MTNQQIMLTPQVIEQIRVQTGQKWRDCQRKDYNIYACAVPAGYVFANKLEQPESYNAIMRVNRSNPFIKSDDVAKYDGLSNHLIYHGCYQTDGTRIVLCGTQGELWDVKPEKLVASYKLPDGRPIDLSKIGKNWFTVMRASETKPSSVGIQIPARYLGVYKTSWATLTVNNPASSGHGSGDILVAPKLPNGQPDYTNISPTNNAVFALTYNQNVGGWGKSGMILQAGKIKHIDISQLPKFTKVAKNPYDYGFNLIKRIMHGVQEVCHIQFTKDTIEEMEDVELGYWFSLDGKKPLDGSDMTPYFGLMYDTNSDIITYDLRLKDADSIVGKGDESTMGNIIRTIAGYINKLQ